MHEDDFSGRFSRDRENLRTSACGAYDAHIGFKGRKSLRKGLPESKTANSISALSRTHLHFGKPCEFTFAAVARDSVSTFPYSSMLISFTKLFKNRRYARRRGSKSICNVNAVSLLCAVTRTIIQRGIRARPVMHRDYPTGKKQTLAFPPLLPSLSDCSNILATNGIKVPSKMKHSA